MASNKKRGPKTGTGSKPERFNMRCGKHFRSQLEWIRNNERSVYKGYTDSDILEQMVSDHVLLLEVSHGQRWKP